MPAYRQNDQKALAAPKPLAFGGRGAEIQTAPGRLELGFTLDCSDSMHRLFEAAANGFNAFVADQCAGGPGNFTFNCFSSRVYPIFAGLDLAQVEPINRAFLEGKAGATALLDGIGAVIRAVGKRFDSGLPRPRALVAILTDGLENASREFSQTDIFQMIHYRRSVHRWEFLFICASEAGEKYGLSLGIQKANICRFDTSPEGIKILLGRLSRSVSAFRLGDRQFAGLLTDQTKDE